jgi:hypothetical protein
MTKHLNNGTTGRPTGVTGLMQEYCRQAEVVMLRAKKNKRALSDDDLKKLGELARIIRGSDGVATPEEKENPLKAILEEAERGSILYAADRVSCPEIG